jgi:GntR family transcriptional regulator, trigonelline degradation regulator
MTIESTGTAPDPRGQPIHKLAAPLRQQVLERLRTEIINGRRPPGARLVERELIEMLGVSRTVVREALRQLESEGLVAIVPNKGPVVRGLTEGEAKDLYHIRSVLEGLAARLFVENASNMEVKTLGQSLEHVATAYAGGDVADILETKNHFYDVLFEGARSPTLSEMLNALHGRIRRWRALGLSHPDRTTVRGKESLRNLRSTLASIRKRDAEGAERALREEVNRAAAEIMRLLGS